MLYKFMYQATRVEMNYRQHPAIKFCCSDCLTNDLEKRRKWKKTFLRRRPQNAFLMVENFYWQSRFRLLKGSFKLSSECKLGNFAVESINRISISTCEVFAECRSKVCVWRLRSMGREERRKMIFDILRSSSSRTRHLAVQRGLLAIFRNYPTLKRYA